MIIIISGHRVVRSYIRAKTVSGYIFGDFCDGRKLKLNTTEKILYYNIMFQL